MMNLFNSLISSTHGQGPSSTRLVYLMNGLAAVMCALLMTIGGIIVYCVTGNANATYWTGTVALWTATLGFGARAKNEQQKSSKEIALASSRPAMASASGD